MPEKTITCPHCKRVGFVRVETIVHGGQAIQAFYCGGCGHTWERADGATGATQSQTVKRESPDRSRS